MLYPNIYVAGGCPAGRFAGLASKKRRFARARRLFRETWSISVEKGLYPEKEQAAACFAGELCKGISTKSYIFPEGKTAAKAFPMCLFLQRLQNE
ncbi:hypothetical protein PX860_21605 [Agrobacterium leguminum]|uniref:hypothetical protein n=1 Tax=Agrobacterium TaxID=357 RepID=UPI00115D4D56|nr:MULTISPECIES: hypothetical protein [Agrobacterium]WLD99677.1 hypothetical protein PX860_21605 [Agrobacterium leguminum]